MAASDLVADALTPLIDEAELPVHVKYLLNVKQPAAWAIMSGYKDVENRSQQLDHTKKGIWIALVASKAQPNADIIKFVQKKLPEGVVMPSKFALGAIIGLVRFSGSKQNVNSDWYNKGAHGWIIDGVHPFNTPITDVTGMQVPIARFNVKSRKKDEQDRIQDELAKYEVFVQTPRAESRRAEEHLDFVLTASRLPPAEQQSIKNYINYLLANE